MLFGTPVYASMNAEYAYLPYREMRSGEITLDKSLGRVDLAPQMRIPLSRLTYLSVNTSATSRTTYYTRSAAADGTMVPEGLVRQFLTTRTDIIGPVLTKIWDTPDSLATERMKHVIEPAFTLDYTTGIDNQSSVPQLSDISDIVIGGTTRFTYGLFNRFFYRSRPREGAGGTTREFLTLGLQQTYYSNVQASRFDTVYVSATGRRNLVDLSPIALTARVSPNTTLDASARLEYDVSGNGLQIFSTNATANLVAAAPSGGVSPRQMSVNAGYNRARYTRLEPVSQYLSLSTNSRWLDGRVGATYGLSWDIERAYIQSQSVMASYMAQCCGIQADFQTVNYPDNPAFPIRSDRRFNFSVVLAGLGTFSNFFGAFGQR
jgi:hypothetical protein